MQIIKGKEVFDETFFFTNRVEDHDDLTPIFNRQSDVLTSTYGMLTIVILILYYNLCHKRNRTLDHPR